MKSLIVFILLYGMMATIPEKYISMKKIEKNGMVVHWKIGEDHIDFEVFAPAKGWLAIGLNTNEKLKGNNLIMGKIEDGEVTINDRFIVGVGDHRAVEDLGGSDHLFNLAGEENARGSIIRFSIATRSRDAFHYNWQKHQPCFLLLAYSREDDFLHHSTMRTSLRIIL